MQMTKLLLTLSMVLALFCVRAGATVPGIASELIDRYESLPAQGDDVKYTLAEHPGQSFYGRVAAIPGQTVEIRGCELLVNATQMHDRIYALVPKSLGRRMGPLRVPEGYAFIVQGNYQPNTYIGLVPLKQILGKLFLAVLP